MVIILELAQHGDLASLLGGSALSEESGPVKRTDKVV